MCHLCRLKRRELLLRTAEALECAVVALGHHLEDFGETLLLNLLFAGNVQGLRPEVRYFDTFTVVRPLIYVTKKEISALGSALSFPPPPEHCRLSRASRRMALRRFLQDISRGNRHVLTNLLRAGLRRTPGRE